VLTFQTLQITEDPASGLLLNNRWAAGDPGFESPFDFDSTQPGVKRLPPSPPPPVIAANGNNDSSPLGSTTPAAAPLLASFLLANTGPAGRLEVLDGARLARGVYTVNGGFTTDDQALNITLLDGAVFSGGTSLVTGAQNNEVTVLGTRPGEGLTLNSNG